MTDWSWITKAIATLAVDIPIILFLCWLAFWKKPKCEVHSLSLRPQGGYKCLVCKRVLYRYYGTTSSEKPRCKHLGLEHTAGEGFRCLDCGRRPR